MRESRLAALRLKARAVGLTVAYVEQPRRSTRTKTSAERRPKPVFAFFLRGTTEGTPLFTCHNTRMAMAFITGFAHARMIAIRADRAGDSVSGAFDSLAPQGIPE